MNISKKGTILTAAAVFSCTAFADVPDVTSVMMSQDAASREVTVEYVLANAPAVVTLDIQTNDTATGAWASIGGENIQQVTGDVWKRIDANGTHVLKWHPDLSWPDHKIPAGGARAVVTAWALDNTPDYMVVDISAGAAANSQTYYPAQEFVPGGVLANTRYRTTALLMRKIMAKDVIWTMGSVAESGRAAAREATHAVSLSNNYYIGVFPVSQTQWTLVSGYNNSKFSNPAYSAMRPVESVCYNEIRSGASNTTAAVGANYYPGAPHATSYIKKLRDRTGIDFDLPSDAQWEYACRAGHGEGYLGDGSPYTEANVARLGRYKGNGGFIEGKTEPDKDATDEHGTAIIGSYGIPNSWGLYDMHGNVYELCLDWYQDDISAWRGAVNANGSTTLSGDSPDNNRVVKGGCWYYNAASCRSAFRVSSKATGRNAYTGFRLACRAGLK